MKVYKSLCTHLSVKKAYESSLRKNERKSLTAIKGQQFCSFTVVLY